MHTQQSLFFFNGVLKYLCLHDCISVFTIFNSHGMGQSVNSCFFHKLCVVAFHLLWPCRKSIPPTPTINVKNPAHFRHEYFRVEEPAEALAEPRPVFRIIQSLIVKLPNGQQVLEEVSFPPHRIDCGSVHQRTCDGVCLSSGGPGHRTVFGNAQHQRGDLREQK